MFLQQLINGVGIGCTYALIALGYNLQFGVLHVINLAYGEVFIAGAFGALFFSQAISDEPALVFIVGVTAATACGLIIHVFAVKPLGNVASLDSPRHLSVLVSTTGASLFLQNIILRYFGGYPQRFPRLIPEWRINSESVQLDLAIILNLVASLAIMVALYFFINKTMMGLEIKALSENRELALCCGVHSTKNELLAVVISSALAGVAAMLISQAIGTVSPFTGLIFGFKGLIVLIVGGSGNMLGAVAVALLLGVGESMSVAYFSSGYRDALAFSLLLTLLLGRANLWPLWKKYTMRIAK